MTVPDLVSQVADTEPVAGRNDVLESKQGPFREYLPVDTFWTRKVGHLYRRDKIVAIAIAQIFRLLMAKWHPDWLSKELSDGEKEIYRAIEYYKMGKFNLNPLPPLGIQLLSLLPLKIEVLRHSCLILASLTLSFVFLTLRRVATFEPFAICGTVAISCLPIFQQEALSLSIDVFQWFFLSATLYFWRTATCSQHFTERWFTNLLLLSISVGSGMSTKYIGFMTWVWVCVVSVKEFWNVLGDPTLSDHYLIKYATVKTLMLGLIPFGIFVSSLSLNLLNWTHDTPELSQYMSPNFKAYLRGPQEHPKFLYYGAIITLRHHDSLGGYLHSQNETYPTGSGEQMVSLTQEEEDYNNKWRVEPAKPAGNGYELREVKDFGKVRLRHCATGKLLRASSAKPPVSEQEYNSEISCTGDSDYVGDSDELWNVIAVNDPLHSSLKPLKSVVKFLNVGQGCTLLAHDTRLPKWGLYQQEVLCLRSPTESRTLFEIETEQLNSTQSFEQEIFTGDKRRVIGFLKLLSELVQRQYKWNYYENKFKLKSSPAVEKWPFQFFDKKFVSHIWLSSVIYPVCFIIYQGIQMLPGRWFSAKHTVKDLNTTIYVDFAVECLLGWFLHYYPFVSSPHEDLKMFSYLSSLLFGQLLVWKAIDTWSKSRLLYGVLVCIYIAYVVHA